jgi:hypothetical protein
MQQYINIFMLLWCMALSGYGAAVAVFGRDLPLALRSSAQPAKCRAKTKVKVQSPKVTCRTTPRSRSAR